MRWISARALVAGVVGLASATGCDSATGNKEPRITLSASGTSVALEQGASASVTLSVQRNNFDKAVFFVVQGAPEGVTAVATPLTSALTSTTLEITASGAATPGTAALQVKASGEGITDQTVTITLTVTVKGTFALTALNSSVTVAQGGGGSATVLIPRAGGNAGNVSLSLSGLPTGMTATITATPTTTTSALVTLSATAGTAPGTYPITVTGSSPGLVNQTTSLSIVVIPPSSTVNISIPFCSSDLPVWFAYQNEGFSWQQVTPTGSSFNFAATQKLSVAYVFSGGDTQINIFSVTRAEFSASNDRDCSGPRNYSGTIAGATTGQTAKVVMGTSTASATWTATGYSLTEVPARPMDLVATLGTPSGNYLQPDKMIVRRSLDLATGSTIPVLDFSLAEAFTPAATNLSILGLQAADQTELQNTFWTPTSTFGTAQSAAVTSNALTLYSVPAAQQVAGDLHELYIDASQSTSSQLNGRSYVEYFTAAGADRTVQMGPSANIPAISTIAVSPYARTRGVLASQPQYDAFAEFAFIQDQPSGASRIVLVGTSSGYLGATPATWDISVPDFTGTAGFNQSWMLAPNQSTVYFAEVFAGRADLLFGALPALGDVARLAYHAALTNTSQLYRVKDLQRTGRRLPQYLRR